MNTSRVIMDAYMLSYVYKWGYNKITILTKLTIKLIAPVDCFHPLSHVKQLHVPNRQIVTHVRSVYTHHGVL